MGITTIGWNLIKKRMAEHDYPAHRSFDPKTFRPAKGSLNTAAFKGSCLEVMKYHFVSLLDIGCNKGFFSFVCRKNFDRIVGIDPMKEMIGIASDIRDAHKLEHIFFMDSRFENYDKPDTYDVVHFGQCCHYLFRDGFRRNENPLWFLIKAKALATKYIVIDGAFDGDPSVEYDASKDNWPPIVKRMATIEGYAGQLRPEFRLIRYGWSGDGATRYMAIFERI